MKDNLLLILVTIWAVISTTIAYNYYYNDVPDETNIYKSKYEKLTEEVINAQAIYQKIDKQQTDSIFKLKLECVNYKEKNSHSK